MVTRMKTIFVTNSLSGGGAESSMRVINQYFQSVSKDSMLVCLNKIDGGKPTLSEIELDREWKSGVFQTISNFIGFYRTIKRLNPDVIVANCELPELYAAFLPVRVKKLICVEHTSQPWAGRKGLGKIVRAILLIRQSKWVTVNKAQVAIWPFRTKATYIPNPVAVPKLNTNKVASPEFVFVGRLRTEKGIETILHATSSEKMMIDVFGSGDLEAKLKAQFSNVAVFHGFVDEPWRFISPEQVLVVASEYEGDGKVIVEGILAGVPILLLDNADLRRIELPDRNYFADVIELRKKMNDCRLHKEEYQRYEYKSIELKAEREITSVVGNWEKILF